MARHPGNGRGAVRRRGQLTMIRQERGFSLVESLVACLILALVGGVILVLSQTTQRVLGVTDAELTNLTDAQQALNRLTEDLHKACQGTLGCAAGQVIFKQPSGGSSTCLAGDPNITYALTAGRLTRQVGGGAPVDVATGLTAFTPACQANGVVKLRLTAQMTKPNAPSVTHRLESHVWARNP